MEMKDYYYSDIKMIDKNGILLKDNTELLFDECVENWGTSHNLCQGESVCVGERDISATIPYFIFYTEEKTRINFSCRFLFWRIKKRKEFEALRRKIVEFNYTTYDLG